MQMVVLGPGIVIFKKTFKVIQNQQKCQTAKKSKGKKCKHGKKLNAQKLNDNFTLVHYHLNDITQTLQQRPDCLQ